MFMMMLLGILPFTFLATEAILLHTLCVLSLSLDFI